MHAGEACTPQSLQTASVCTFHVCFTITWANQLSPSVSRETCGDCWNCTFYRQDALADVQPRASKHWRHRCIKSKQNQNTCNVVNSYCERYLSENTQCCCTANYCRFQCLLHVSYLSVPSVKHVPHFLFMRRSNRTPRSGRQQGGKDVFDWRRSCRLSNSAAVSVTTVGRRHWQCKCQLCVLIQFTTTDRQQRWLKKIKD